MSVARLPFESDDRESKKAKKGVSPVLGFSDEDKIRTTQPRDDALVVTLRIGGYHVKRVLVGHWQCCGSNVPRPVQGSELETRGLNIVQFRSDKLRRKDNYPNRPNQIAHTNRLKRGRSGFHFG